MTTLALHENKTHRNAATPNHSIERTSNGGAHWRAPSRPVAPLAAAHVKR
jgi:hypothetical protein